MTLAGLRHWANRLGRRIAVLIIGLTLLLATAGSAISILLTQAVLHDSIDEQLRITVGHRHTSAADLSAEMPIHSVVVWHDNGRDEFSNGEGVTLSASDKAILHRSVTGPEGLTTARVDGHDMRVIVRQVDDRRVLAAMSLEGTQRDIVRLAALEMGCWFFAGGAAALAGVILSQHLTRPLRDVAVTAKTVASAPVDSVADVVTRRVPVTSSAVEEVTDVTTSVNGLLGQVEKALQRRDESEDALRSFLADVSHELRTPIAVVRSHAELASQILVRYYSEIKDVWPGEGHHERPLTPEGHVRLEALLRGLAPIGDQLWPSLQRIEREGARMGRLVDDLLILARAGASRRPELTGVDLTFVALEAISDARLLAPDHRWGFESTGEPVEITSNEDGVRRVITNLVTNAHKHTPAGTSVTVDVTEDEQWAFIVVRDNGPGLPSHVAAAPGTRFTGRDHADSTSTGLGLAITRALVESLGGEIAFDSSSEGTTITVKLPKDA